MVRRHFLNLITGLFGGKIIFSRPLFLFQNNLFARQYQHVTVQNTVKNISEKIIYKIRNGLIYIPLTSFARINDYGIFTNDSRRKTVLYVGNDKIKFTADNSFIILNEQIYQYFHEPAWFEGELWAPAEVLADLFTNYTSIKMRFDARAKELVIGSKNVNITGVQISEKANGTLIQCFSNRSFKEKEIALKIVNDWLYVDVFGGRVDTESIAAVAVDGVVSKVQAIQFEQLVSLAFRLNQPIENKELVVNNEANGFIVNLRTKEQLARREEEDSENELEKQKNDWLVDTIVIDPGHGGKDPGAIGYGNLREKDIVLSIALKLGAIIKKELPGIKVVYTRDDDTFIPLWKRTKIANNHDGKLFISLHCNATSGGRARGFETYFLSAEKDGKARDVVLQENASIQFEDREDKKRYEGINFILATMAQNAFIKQSQYLATTVQKSLAKNLTPIGMKDRGVKQGPFWVMVGATMPNILVETGFISNKYEAKLLKRRSTQMQLAEAMFEGIRKYKNDIENSI